MKYSKYLKIGVTILIAATITVLFFSPLKQTASPRSKIQFVCLAWQEDALVAYKSIVDRWNKLHPESQVEYVQATWGAIHDYLITGFETGDVPDVFQYESSAIIDFAVRGYLEDLSPLVSHELRTDVCDAAWASVRRSNGSLSGVPVLMESLIILYNKDLFEQAGISPPDFEHPWTWDNLRVAARKLTKDTDGDGRIDQYGVGMGLRNGANIVMNLTIGFDGSYFRKENGEYIVHAGGNEKQFLSIVMDMMYRDSTMTTAGLGQSGPGMMPGFMNGKFAILAGIGAWSRQQLMQNAPKNFHWGVLPPLKAKTQNIGTSTQTFSIPKASQRKKEAMAFIEFMTSKENMALIAASDWMIPARTSCLALARFRTSGDGWDIASQSAKFLTAGEWVGAPGYIEWKTRVANPVLQELFANRMSVDEALRRIELESNIVLSRYKQRDQKW